MIITGPPTHSGGRWGQNSNDRGRLSSSVTLHGGHAGGGQAMTSLFLQSNYRSTDARWASRVTSRWGDTLLYYC